MTSRERVDSAVEDAGSEVLSKVGVPKGLAKKAVKAMVESYLQLIMV